MIDPDKRSDSVSGHTKSGRDTPGRRGFAYRLVVGGQQATAPSHRDRQPMTSREVGGWIVFTVLLCLVAVAGVVMLDDEPALAPIVQSGAVRPSPVHVVDGDTLDLAGQRIRLWGIDAPELSQTCQARDGQSYACGRDAAAVLTELTRNRQVMCDDVRDRDQYGRIVAVCRSEAGEINAAMVQRGWAIDFTRFSGGRYRQEQVAAQAAGAGMWAGRFDQPADWRREQRRK